MWVLRFLCLCAKKSGSNVNFFVSMVHRDLDPVSVTQAGMTTVRTPTTLTYVRVVQDGGRYVTLSSFLGLFC